VNLISPESVLMLEINGNANSLEFGTAVTMQDGRGEAHARKHLPNSFIHYIPCNVQCSCTCIGSNFVRFGYATYLYKISQFTGTQSPYLWIILENMGSKQQYCTYIMIVLLI